MAFRDDFGGTALRADWQTAIEPSDDPNALIVSGSTVALKSGVTPNQFRYFALGLGAQRRVAQLNFLFKLSARGPNMTWFGGLFDNQDPRAATSWAAWRWSGSSLPTVAFAETNMGGASEGFGVNRTVSTSVIASSYYVYLDTAMANFRQGGVSFPPTTDIVSYYTHIPDAQQNLWMVFGVLNGPTAPATSQTMTIDVVEFSDSVMT
jgi:hypothetical protein